MITKACKELILVFIAYFNRTIDCFQIKMHKTKYTTLLQKQERKKTVRNNLNSLEVKERKYLKGILSLLRDMEKQKQS